MTKNTYMFVRQVHFGGLKFSLTKGSMIDIVEEDDKRYAIVNGEKVEKMSEFDLCIKNGFMIPYEEGTTEKVDTIVKTMKRKTDNKKKMTVEKSDADLMKEEIDISHTKNEKIKEKREKEIKEGKKPEEKKDIKTVRGMKVIQADEKAIGGLKEVSDENISTLVNGDDAKIIATIGEKKEEPKEIEKPKKVAAKKATAKKATTKKVTKAKEMSEEVKARLAARKKQAQEGHEKTVAQENK